MPPDPSTRRKKRFIFTKKAKPARIGSGIFCVLQQKTGLFAMFISKYMPLYR